MDENRNQIVYLNGDFVPRSEARLDIEDRAIMFADGVYEVVRYYDGRAFAMDEHIGRLKQSLRGIGMSPPPVTDRMNEISDELIARNGCPDAKVYWQFTRGAATREHQAPTHTTPTVFAIAYPDQAMDVNQAPAAISAIVVEDRRASLSWIKSIMLLPNVLAKNQATAKGADEAIFRRGEFITEATSASVLIVRDGELWTHPANQWILASVTRAVTIDMATGLGIAVIEQPFSQYQLNTADEVMICGTTRHVTAVVDIDGKMIGDGSPGPLTCRLNTALLKHIASACQNPT